MRTRPGSERFDRWRRRARAARWPAIAIALLAALILPLHAQSGLSTGTRCFCWKVSGQQGAAYLVGSVHVLTADYYPVAPAMERAYQDSHQLVEEVDLDELSAPASQMRLLTRGLFRDGKTLQASLSAATFDIVNRRVAELGMPLEPLQRFKPWMLALTLEALLYQKAGFDPKFGLDQHYFDKAKRDRKPVHGLETLEYQISRFDELSATSQEQLLLATLESTDRDVANVRRVADAWKAGDTAIIERLGLDDMKDSPEAYQRLLVDRNRNWLPKIEALLAKPERAFIVVGAAHLVGPDGLLTHLKARGYAIVQQ